MADLNMILDRTDDQDRPIGTIARRDVFARGANFRVVHVFLFTTTGELLVQQIAPGLRHEGQWGSSAAGYVAAGETYRAAAVRKTSDELGLTGLPLTEYGRTSMVDSGARKFITLFTGTYDGRIVPNAFAVAALALLPLTQLRRERVAGTRTFTKTFLHLLDFYSPGQAP